MSFKQEDSESLSSSWERFELLCKSGPDLGLQDQILLQHFYIGLNKESRAYLNTSSHGSFIHLTSSEARTILDNILASTNDDPVEENILEEEIPEVATPEPMPESSQPVAIELSKEKHSFPDFMNDIEDDLFSDFGNTSNYHQQKKPRKRKLSSQKEFDRIEQHFSREHVRKLASVMSAEWLEESELSSDIIRLDSPSVPIQCIINAKPYDALYNPVIGVNIMALSFYEQISKNMPLSPTAKLLKQSSGQIIPSSGILYTLPIQVNDMLINLSFYIFDIREFDLLIGHPLERLLVEGHTGKLDICLGKNKFPLHFAHSIHTKTEPSPEPDPMEEVKEASIEHFVESNQEDVTEFFIEEEEENPTESEPLDELEEPSRPPIELKPLPPGLRYAFLHNDPESPVNH